MLLFCQEGSGACQHPNMDRRLENKTVRLISQLLKKVERCSTSGFEGHEILGVVGYVRITQVDHVGCDVT